MSVKLCECGCGEPAPIADRTDRASGTIKGQPKRFVRWHAGRSSPTPYVVDAATGCWIWQWTIARNGYGFTKVAGKTRHAHRVYYERHVGPVPDGLTLDHLYRNRACVNPAHLEPVTIRENTLRGEGPSARNAAKTHCKYGHECTPENTHMRPSGSRSCRVCLRERQREYRAERRRAR